MDDKPPQGQPTWQLPKWVSWLPVPFKLIPLILILGIVFGATGILLAILTSFILFFWGVIQLGTSENVPAHVRVRFAWVRQFRTTTSDPEKIRCFAIGGVFIVLAFISLLALNKTPLRDLSAILFFYPFFIIGLLVILAPFPILKRDCIVQEWSTLIIPGAPQAEIFFTTAEAAYQSLAPPNVRATREMVAPSRWKQLVSISTSFELRRLCFVLKAQTWTLAPYHIYMSAHPYGTSLHAVCCVTMEVGIFRRILAHIPLLGRIAKVKIDEAGFVEPNLDVFERQDLSAYSTAGHFIWKHAVDFVLLSLNQIPKEQKIHAKGFLGIEE